MSQRGSSPIGCLVVGFVMAIAATVGAERAASASFCRGYAADLPSKLFTVLSDAATLEESKSMCLFWLTRECVLDGTDRLYVDSPASPVSGATREIVLGPYTIEVEI